MEKWRINHGKETFSGMLKLKIIKTELGSNQNKMVGGVPSNGINKLCAGQAIKNGSVDRSVEPLGAQWDEEMANK